jgi:uncharacterized OsmC-like protein
MFTTLTKPNGLDLEALGATVAAIGADPVQAKVRFGVKTQWTGQTRSESTVDHFILGGERIERRFKIVADEPLELLGSNTAANPQELLMAAVNACMIVGYVANASLRGITLEWLEIEMHGTLDLRGFLGLDDDVSPGYREIDYSVRLHGDGTPEQFAEIHQAVMRTSPNFFNMAQPIRLNGRMEMA